MTILAKIAARTAAADDADAAALPQNTLIENHSRRRFLQGAAGLPLAV